MQRTLISNAQPLKGFTGIKKDERIKGSVKTPSENEPEEEPQTQQHKRNSYAKVWIAVVSVVVHFWLSY